VKYLSSLLGLLTVAWAVDASAVTVFEDKEKGVVVNVGTLLQPQIQVTTPGGGADGEGPCGSATNTSCSAGVGNPEGGTSIDMFMRRARLMLWGNVTKELSFFIDTDQTNWGKAGNYASSMIVQDAFFSYTFMPEFRIDAGLMLVPLSHHTLEGATSLNALDYHSDLIRFPAGINFRDVGLQFRGLVAGDKIHYRLGIFEGVRDATTPAAPMGTPEPSRVNNLGLPRVAGQVRFNVLGVEPDWFFKGIYFSETPIVSIGVGGDFQPNSVLTSRGDRQDYGSASLDVFAEIPFSAEDEVIVKANVFYHAIGTSTMPTGNARPQGAIAGYLEAGYRHGWIEPLAFIEAYQENDDQDEPGSRQMVSPHVGVNFWAMKHNFNVKTDLGYRVYQNRGEDPPAAIRDLFWTTQGQLFF